MILEKDDEIISVASIRYDIITIFFLLGLFDLICWPVNSKSVCICKFENGVELFQYVRCVLRAFTTLGSNQIAL